MVTQVSRLRLEFAAIVFLAEFRKQFVAQHPERECLVKAFEDYSPEHRSALMAAVERAALSVDPAKDTVFETWLSQHQET